jgi:hypothetical protein
MRKALVLGLVAALGLVGISGCRHGSKDSEDYKNYLVIARQKFRKKGAFKADMLWAGVKKSEGVNSFEPKFFPVLNNEIEILQATEAFNKQTRKTAVEAASKAGIEIAEGSVSGSASSESASTGKFSVFILREVNKFVEELNAEVNQKGIDVLRRYDNPRIITSVATVFNRESSNKIENAGEVSLSIKKTEIGNPEFTIKANRTGETLATLSDGTVFAYQYSRICWEKQNGTIKIFTLEVDNPGMDDSCPSGTSDDASKL